MMRNIIQRALILLACILYQQISEKSMDADRLWKPDSTSAFEVGTQIRPWTIVGGANIDLWKMKLDPVKPEWERITWFNEGGIYKASNPVVSDDGKYIAFQMAGVKEVAGIGHGIYILDLEKWIKSNRK